MIQVAGTSKRAKSAKEIPKQLRIADVGRYADADRRGDQFNVRRWGTGGARVASHVCVTVWTFRRNDNGFRGAITAGRWACRTKESAAIWRFGWRCGWRLGMC